MPAIPGPANLRISVPLAVRQETTPTTVSRSGEWRLYPEEKADGVNERPDDIGHLGAMGVTVKNGEKTAITARNAGLCRVGQEQYQQDP